MTIEELYEWAKENEALDADLVVYDCDGSTTHYIDPIKVVHTCLNGNYYYEVELR